MHYVESERGCLACAHLLYHTAPQRITTTSHNFLMSGLRRTGVSTRHKSTKRNGAPASQNRTTQYNTLRRQHEATTAVANRALAVVSPCAATGCSTQNIKTSKHCHRGPTPSSSKGNLYLACCCRIHPILVPSNTFPVRKTQFQIRYYTRALAVTRNSRWPVLSYVVNPAGIYTAVLLYWSYWYIRRPV